MSEQEFQEAFKRYAYFPRTKIPYMTLRKLRSTKSKTIGNKGWGEYLQYLSRGVDLSPTLHERVQFGTFTNLLKMWMQNLADNLPFIRHGETAQTIADIAVPEPVIEQQSEFSEIESPIVEKNGVKLKDAPAGSAIVVGRGPSLFENKHCELLQKSDYKGLIVASDGGLIPLIESGVIPNFVVTVDGAPVIKKYFDHPLVQENGDKIKFVCTTTINHQVMLTAKELGMQIYWFSPIFDDIRDLESFTRLQKLLTTTDAKEHGVPRLNSGGNSGACAWNLAMSVFKRAPVCLIGIDFGYPETVPLEHTQYYAQILEEAKGDVSIIKKAYNTFYHPTFKKKAYVDFVFYHYRQAFLELQQLAPLWYRLYGGTINCTEGGTLFGPGINCMTFKEFLTKYKR